jgi:hypothetical protein
MPDPQPNTPEERGILLEKICVGGFVRVTAVCAATGTEVVFIAPPHASDQAVDHLAAAKLARAIGARGIGARGIGARAIGTQAEMDRSSGMKNAAMRRGVVI